jgi:hypothetical protein
LGECDLHSASLTDVLLERCDLRQPTSSGATVERVEMRGCDLTALAGRRRDRDRRVASVRLPYDPGVPHELEATTIVALKRVPLFSSLEGRDLAVVARISNEAEFGVGETLIHEDEPGRHFFVVLEGEASVQRGGTEINRMGPNDFFGEISLLSDRPTTASVVTTSPARIVVITPPDFKELLEAMPLLQMKVIQALADRLPDDFYWQG